MTLRRLLKVVCPTACAACLTTGYISAGKGVAVALVAAVWLGWLFAAALPSAIMLTASVGLAVGGLSAGATPFLMILGATLALASWDLAGWDDFLAGNLSPEVENRLERKHYACLALALVPALLFALTGQLIHFQIPFGGLVAMVLLALLGLDRLRNHVKD